ncbi:MAG: TMEM43 family protein [Acidobacteriota bacterium]
MADDDSYVEETTTGWFGRIGDSFKGILFGIVLIIVSGVLLFWNEGRTVKTMRALQEAAGALVVLASPTADPANAGKLVYATGNAATDETLQDKSFGIAVNAIRLKRMVEFYVWKEEQHTETKKETGGSETKRTTYTYKKVWSDRLIDSSGFKKPQEHVNPTQVPFSSQDFWANQVKLGTFSLPRNLLSKLDSFDPQPMDPSSIEKLPSPLKEKAQLVDNWCYIGNAQEPNIGDLRVKFSAIRPGPVSVVARQAGASFEPYTAGSGYTVELIEPGTRSPETMFNTAKEENKLLAWILRAVGAVFMFIGFVLILKPISVFFDVLPILGDIAGLGTGLIAFVVSLSLSLLIVAIAWFSYRPILSVSLIGSAIVLLFLMKMRKGRATR